MAVDQERFAGLNTFCRHAPERRLLSNEFRYDFENPPANPGLHLPYREALVESAEAFVGDV